MKIEKIKFPLNIGYADALTLYVRKDLDAKDYVIVYYAFIDTTRNSKLTDGSEIPNKMLYADSLKLSGENYTEYENDNSKLDSIMASLLGIVIASE
jgi:hypothetical protein